LLKVTKLLDLMLTCVAHELPLQGTTSLAVLNIIVFPEDFGVGDEELLQKWYKISEKDQQAIDNMLSIIQQQCSDLGREIDKKVLANTMHEQGDKLLGSHLYDTINALDIDKDGKVTHNEFREYFAGICLEAYKAMRQAKKEFMASVKSCDKNKDGFIDKDEFKDFYHKLMARDQSITPVSSEDLEKLLMQCDLNGDGRVSVEELVTAMAPEVNSYLD
jgi:Ca2+-binding EF-hand superfamily protein